MITVSDEVASGADTNRGGPMAAGLLGELGCEGDGRGGSGRSAGHRRGDRRGDRRRRPGGAGLRRHRHRPAGTTPRRRSGRCSPFEIPGIAEEIRRRGLTHTPQALVSREVAGVVTGGGPPAGAGTRHSGLRGGVRDALAWSVTNWATSSTNSTAPATPDSRGRSERSGRMGPSDGQRRMAAGPRTGPPNRSIACCTARNAGSSGSISSLVPHPWQAHQVHRGGRPAPPGRDRTHSPRPGLRGRRLREPAPPEPGQGTNPAGLVSA